MIWSENKQLTLTATACIKPTSSHVVGIWASGFFGSKYGDLLYVLMRAWVARLITWARQLQLLFIQLTVRQLDKQKYFIWRLHHGNCFCVCCSMWWENSSNIVPLLPALSHVMWPIWNEFGQQYMPRERCLLTLCSIPTCWTTLYSAWPSCFLLWALLSCMNPSNAVLSSQCEEIDSSIQCPMTAK